MVINLEQIFPLIVPNNYYKGTEWSLPHFALPDKAFALTWVIIDSADAMSYLTPKEYQELNDSHEDWPQAAFENLRNSIADGENFYTQFKTSDDGKRLIFVAFMHSDGLGSSRVLLSNELEKSFPAGYHLAFPDRSCGLVVAKDIKSVELAEVRKMVKSMHKGAATPMSGQLHAATDVFVPQRWSEPIDKSFSEILIKEVIKLRGAV